jgi:Bacterial Ig-like domain (group 2)/PKD domain
MLNLWQRLINRRSSSSQACRRNTKRPSVRLELIRLEDRVTPSVSVLSSFQGMNYGNAPGSVPPDTIAAVGPSEVIETVNTSIAIYNKIGGTPILNPTSLSTFFQSVGPIHTLSDSVVAYDELNGKFFVGVLNLSTNFLGTAVTADSFLYAVSNTSSPASASDFQFYSANLTGRDPAGSGSFWGDYPRIGWNANEYVATFNMFTTNSAQSYGHALVLNISTATPSTTTAVDDLVGGTNATLAPATMHGAAASDPMYFVEETLNSLGNFTGNSIRVVTETNPFTTPAFGFTDVTLPAADDYTAPPNATQKGSSNLIQTNDSRILNAEWRGNHLVAAQAVGVASDAQAHARWYEFDTTTTPQFVQAGTIGVGSGANSYFPSIAIAANDVLAMDYMESSSTEYMSVYVTGRVSSDPSNQMEPSKLAQLGQAPYTGFDTPPNRAGDFSGITVDGDGSFWAANEYATSDTTQPANWGTAIAHFQISNPAAPPVIVSAGANPNPVTGSTTTLSVTAVDPNLGAAITGYTWSVQQGPSGVVTFDSNNGTSNGNSVTATFTQYGSYTFLVKVTDSLGASSSTTVGVTVQQTLTSIAVSPATATVVDGNTKQFAASARDQFGAVMATQPSISWSVATGGAGTISSAGVYTAPSTPTGTGTATVQASSGAVTGTATVNYTPLQPPTVTQPASATLSSDGKSASLSVAATDPNGAAITSYSWTVSGPSGVTFSSNNGDATGNNATAYFTQTGAYTFTVTITDSLGATSTSTTQLTVGQVLTSIAVTPATASVPRGHTQQFKATAFDQFGALMTTQPKFTWSIAPGGIGSISSTGLYQAPKHRGTATVRATSGLVSGTAVVTVT